MKLLECTNPTEFIHWAIANERSSLSSDLIDLAGLIRDELGRTSLMGIGGLFDEWVLDNIDWVVDFIKVDESEDIERAFAFHLVGYYWYYAPNETLYSVMHDRLRTI